MGRAGPCPSQRHGPWCLLPQGSRSSQRGEPYTERTLASQAAYTARWKQQEKLQEEVTEEFGAHAGPGCVERLGLQAALGAGVLRSGFHEPIAAMHLGEAGLSPGALVFPLGHLVSPSYNKGSWP